MTRDQKTIFVENRGLKKDSEGEEKGIEERRNNGRRKVLEPYTTFTTL